jgi:hypothetical protein
MKLFSSVTGVALLLAGCSRSERPSVVRLVDVFEESMVEGEMVVPPSIARTEWRFEDGASAFTAVVGVEGLAARDGVLRGKASTNRPLLDFERTTDLESLDQLHAVEVRMRVSGGGSVAVDFSSAETLDSSKVIEEAGALGWFIESPLVPGEEMRTYTLRPPRPIHAGAIRRILLKPTDESGAEFEIESIRAIFRKEHLAGIERDAFRMRRSTGVIVARAPKSSAFLSRSHRGHGSRSLSGPSTTPPSGSGPPSATELSSSRRSRRPIAGRSVSSSSRSSRAFR